MGAGFKIRKFKLNLNSYLGTEIINIKMRKIKKKNKMYIK
jgi:hypothetical protein